MKPPDATTNPAPAPRLHAQKVHQETSALKDGSETAKLDLRALFIAAFHLAQQQAKAEWRRMNIGVLKNRLLYLTHGSFSEQNFGRQRFRDLVGDFPDLLRIDDSKIPADVELLASADSGPKAAVGDRKRIRADLWKAVLDFTSGTPYVWDAEQGLAREATPGDTCEKLPTMSKPELAEWRADFVAKIADSLPPNDRTKVDEWQANGLPTIALPPRLRGTWNQELKRRVEERLSKWFADRHQEPKISATVPANNIGDAKTHELRGFIISCVEQMTQEELEHVSLPANALARNKKRVG